MLDSLVWLIECWLPSKSQTPIRDQSWGIISLSVSHRENSTQLLYGSVHRHRSNEVQCVYGNTAYISSDLRQHPSVLQQLLTADSDTDKAISNAIG